MTESEMIRGVIAREREAIAFLVEAYRKKVIKTAYYFLGNMEDAEDLSQEIFVQILKSMPEFRQSASLSTWIYRISVNYSLNAVKRKKQREIFVRIEHFFGIGDRDENNRIEDVADGSDPAEENENRQRLWKMISALPENQRKVFILSKFEGLSYKDITEVTGHSLSSVESLMHRAKQNLQTKLIQHHTQTSK